MVTPENVHISSFIWTLCDHILFWLLSTLFRNHLMSWFLHVFSYIKPFSKTILQDKEILSLWHIGFFMIFKIKSFTGFVRITKPQRSSCFLEQLYNQIPICAMRTMVQTVFPEWKRFLQHLPCMWTLNILNLWSVAFAINLYF